MSKLDRLKEKLQTTAEEAIEADIDRIPLRLVPRDNDRARETKQGDLEHIPLSEIVVEPQYRRSFDDDSIKNLAESIRDKGMLAPIVVRWKDGNDRFVVVAGERRFRAAKRAGLISIPAFIHQLTDDEAAEICLTENVSREDLNPMELAQGFDDLKKRLSITYAEVAKRVGVDPSTVTRAVRLLKLPGDIQTQIASGDLSPRAGRELARLPDANTQRAVLQTAREQAMTAEQTEELVKRRVGTKRQAAVNTSFDTEYGKVVIVVENDATYHHVEEALKQAIEEVRLRINNRVTL